MGDDRANDARTNDVRTRNVDTVDVTTPDGSVRAERRADGVIAARGIRYAHARRFDRPLLVPAVGDARAAAAQCPQIPGPLEAMLGGSDIPMSEDCLSLSVWTPGTDGDRRPVVVWIHGGAFVTGSGGMPWYDGGALATRGNLVVVSINYRLGAFGYFDDTNAGMWDQIAALEWVRSNIASFGGDPDAVTILGESAGGSSVISLLAAPAARGLFRAAWAMSPSLGQLRGVDRAREIADRIHRATGTSSIDELRDVSIDVLLRAQSDILRERVAGFDAFAPTAAGDGLPDSITAAAARNPVPLVIGTTRDEMQLFAAMDPTSKDLDEPALLDRVARIFPDRAAEVVATYRRYRPDASPPQLLSAITTDQTFRVPAQRLAEQRVANGCPVWSTWFTWASPAFGGIGACHGLDIPFVFHNLGRPGVSRFTGDGDHRTPVADAHADALIRFATDARAPWSAHSDTARPTLRLDADTEQIDDPEPELRALWGDGPAGA